MALECKQRFGREDISPYMGICPYHKTNIVTIYGHALLSPTSPTYRSLRRLFLGLAIDPVCIGPLALPVACRFWRFSDGLRARPCRGQLNRGQTDQRSRLVTRAQSSFATASPKVIGAGASVIESSSHSNAELTSLDNTK